MLFTCNGAFWGHTEDLSYRLCCQNDDICHYIDDHRLSFWQKKNRSCRLAWKPARFHKRSNHWLTVSSRSDRILQTIWVNGVAREPSDPGPDSTNDPINDRISIFSLAHGFSIRSDSTNELGVARIVIPAYTCALNWAGDALKSTLIDDVATPIVMSWIDIVCLVPILFWHMLLMDVIML